MAGTGVVELLHQYQYPVQSLVQVTYCSGAPASVSCRGHAPASVRVSLTVEVPVSTFRVLFDLAKADANRHANAPEVFSLNAYMGTMQDLLIAYHQGAANALELCNAHQLDGDDSPRALVIGLMRHCWEQRVPMVRALPICAVFLRKCARVVPHSIGADSQ